MQISATYEYTAKDYHKFGVFHVFKKSWWRTFRLPILMFAAAVILTALTFIIRRNMITLAIVCAALAIVLPGVTYLLYRAKINKIISKNANFRWTKNIYVFDEDGFDLTVKTGKKEDKARILYQPLHACYETPTHFFLYANAQSAFIIPKKGVAFGEEAALRRLFAQKLQNRFRVWKEKKGEIEDGQEVA